MAIAALMMGLGIGIEPELLAQEPGLEALVAAYGFNEGTGTTTADISGNLHTGTLSGAAWTTLGRYGGAISFDGVNDWVTVNDSALLDLTTGMTIQAWVYPTSAVSNWRTVALKERGVGLAYALYADNANSGPAGYVHITADVAANGTAALALNAWTHLATTYDGATLRLYVNGNLVQSQAVSGSMPPSTNPLRIGGNLAWGEYFAGRIDEVRIHNRALSQTEIQQLMDTPVEQSLGFEFIVYNNPVSMGLSDSGTYNLGITPLGGYTGPVYPRLLGLPANSTGVFEPAAGPGHPGPFALTIFTTATTPPGTYSVTMLGTNGALSATTNLTLIVNGDPDFRISVEPNDLILSQGQNGVATYQVVAENGYANQVSLSASGLPAGASASFTPSVLTPTGSGTVQFNVGVLTPPGLYTVTLSATDGVLTRQTLFTLTVQPPGSSGSWSLVSAGDADVTYYGAIVGDIGNTGKNRVIGSAGSGVMYEYNYSGTSWSFARMPVGVFADGEMHNMDIGPARQDGINRLYIAAAGSGRIYEMSWVNGAWQSNLVVTLNGSTDVIIGDGRNDGVTRMYITWRFGTTEFTWNGTGWSQVLMGEEPGGWVHGIEMGQGRNDGLNRIYTANEGNGDAFEYSWNGSAWSRVFIGNTVDARNIEVGVGRNDGVSRVYVAAGNGNVHEFSWNGSAWQGMSMGNAGIADVKVQCLPAKVRNDNLIRVYVAAGSGVYEYAWTNSTWQAVRLGNAVAYMYGLAVGDGLNNGTKQVYASSYDGNVYVFNWIPTTPNTAPILPVQSDVGIAELSELAVINTASDADVPANNLSYALSDPPANAAIDANGIITWLPTEEQGPGAYLLTTIVSDDGWPPLRATNSFTVNVSEVNVAPVLPVQADVTLGESSLLTVVNTATDEDIPANLLTYQLVNPPANAAIDNLGVITWTPTEAHRPSISTFTTVATDNGVPALSTTNSFTVMVLGANQPPVLASIADRMVHAGSVITLTNAATDPDLPLDTLTYSLLAAPPGANIHPVNGIFTWATTDADLYTTNSITVRVADNGEPSLTDDTTFVVVVLAQLTIETIDVLDEEVTVSWRAIPGLNYQLQYKTALEASTWVEVGDPVEADEPIESMSHLIESDTRKMFYRVIAIP